MSAQPEAEEPLLINVYGRLVVDDGTALLSKEELIEDGLRVESE